MSIISDARRKSVREKRAQARRSCQSHETSTSGRWQLLRELKTKNAELRAVLSEAGSQFPEQDTPASPPPLEGSGQEGSA